MLRSETTTRAAVLMVEEAYSKARIKAWDRLNSNTCSAPDGGRGLSEGKDNEGLGALGTATFAALLLLKEAQLEARMMEA
jgi:hypothetical protein